MSDFLLELSRNPTARKLIKTAGLPVPMPQALRRAKGPYPERPLHDHAIVYGAATGGAMAPTIALTLAKAGADVHLVGEPSLREPFAEPGEAYGRPARFIDLSELPDGFRGQGMVFDATGLADPVQLRALHDFFHPLGHRLANCGRVVVVGRPASAAGTPRAAATAAALEGFVRSLAKEVGKRGSTAQLLTVAEGAEARVEPVLRFLLSPRSAFISGQPVHVDARAAWPGAMAPGSIPMVQSLQGKVALVTGAARGIGAATCELLAAEGAHVVCLDRPQDDALCSQVARKIGGSVLLADVSDPSAPQRIADDLRQRHGGVDVVVHNAGITRDKTLARMKPELWDQTIDVNLAGVVRITEALLGQGGAGPMRDGGRIVLLSSIAGIAGNMGQTNYAASKAGIIGYTTKLASELADRGITVNAIAPGFIETRLTAAIPVMIREAARRLSSLGQGGLPQDVGEAITFLATPGAAGITGRVLRVCGGALVGA
ncbi:3-oxoacyl-ACP reductase [Paraliomyxa miuraensis]|uniref:3-oxoacyl-ACP reductase n=1 Tax=Paraliomyxa miuraensis TaxID=376150 RepID=UPI002254D702|nr:3-oxoacyl-ACP reductase [Paraliomyxa miuraensis]MCX4246946.1 3-oxoacyl-ACP reductase [Paraliomyxa miuraensis]